MAQENKSKVSILTNGIIKENPVLRLVLGTCSILAVTTAVSSALGMGAAFTFVLVCSNIMISLLRKVIPGKVHLPCYIVIIAGFVTIVQMFMQAVEELPQNQQILLNAVNAILAMVHRKGWHETYMAHAYHFLERVRQMDALNGKYQKLQHSYRQVIEQHGKQQWTPVLPKTEEELAAEAAAAEEAAAQAAALKANKGKPVPAPGKTVS